MSAKPASVPRWANVGGAIVVPASGKQDVGWVTGERPPAQYMNWLQNLAYQWLQYLNDGNFSGASTFDNTLGVTGLITATGGMTAAALITANAGLTCGANQHVTVSGTGLYKHGTRTLHISMVAPGALASTGFNSIQMTGGGTNVAVAGFQLPEGSRILGGRARIQDSATGPTKVTFAIARRQDGAGANIGITGASAGTGAVQTLTLSALNYTIPTNEYYFCIVQYNTGTANCQVYGFEVDYDQP